MLACLIGLAFGRGVATAAGRPNVVLIVADDLGYADVGFHGCRDFDTPHLDALAASGVRFTSGYVTHPYCSPSRAGLLTGRYQHRFGHEHNPPFAPDDEAIGTPTGEVLLPQVLRQAGYRTAAVGKWHLGDAPPFLPRRRGFDEHFGFSGGGYDYYGRPRRGQPEHRVVRNGEPVPPEELTYLTDDFTAAAVTFIEQNRQRPFFLYLAYNAPHSPDQAPRRYLDRTRHIEAPFRTVYAAMVLAVDEGVGRVVAALEAAGLREETLVVFLSDNGGRVGSDNRPLRGHKGMLYEGGVRVPFVVSWPGRLPQGRTDDRPVSALDVFPTAAAAAGADVAAARPLDGVDLLPYLTGGKAGQPHEALYWRVIGGKGYAVRRGRWKLVRPVARDAQQLFDLEADPRERHDLASGHPERVQELQSLYRRWDSQMARPLWTDPHAENVLKEREAVTAARRRALPPSDPQE